MRSIFNVHRYCLLFFLVSICSVAIFAADSPHILIKMAVRSFPDTFFATLDAYEKNLSDPSNCHFLIMCDKNDAAMNNGAAIEKLATYSNVCCEFVEHKSLVEAYNYGLACEQFDILIIADDNKEPCAYQFDKIIGEQFQKNFPAFDGVLVCKAGLRTAEVDGIFVIGRAFFDHFGYAFNPEYVEFCAEQELLSTAKMLKKYELLDKTLFCCKCPAKNVVPETVKRHDQETFVARRNKSFDLSEQELRNAVSKEWSILICTMYERKAQFSRLYNKLQNQIKQLGLEDRIEVLYYLDNRGEHSIGNKRNWLLVNSDGYYINFIDDDDDVSDDYVKVIYDALMQRPDSVSLKGLIALNKQDIRLFIHSIKYSSWFEKNCVYYRPPNHLNTIKRSVGVQFSFPDISNGEDHDWSMQIANTGLIKSEVDIKTPYYFYLPSGCQRSIDFSVFRRK